MDVQRNNTRERVFSILNDNDSPSFVIRQKSSSYPAPPTKLPSISSFSSRVERPNLLRQSQYERDSSVSSASSAGTPPLLRFDSHSSKSSHGSMDSSPSPITPAYNYNDSISGPYDSLMRSDLGATYLPSPSTITPFMEHQMMINSGTSAQLPAFDAKAAPMPAYSSMGLPQGDYQQLPTPSLSNHESISSASSSAQTKTSPTATNNLSTGKKNKYPCPYASSHNCLATFTTSGHAARHGKKHTGEKGVHCPVCNKAFTRKDNMKQHERTHKNQAGKSSDESTNRSKAAVTKDAQKAKAHKKTESDASIQTRRTSIAQSPLSEVASLAPNTVDTPITASEATFYQDPVSQMMMVPETVAPEIMSPTSIYPPLSDESMLLTSIAPQGDKLDSTMTMAMPPLTRGFSDLDTLAQAAAADFDPYYQPQF